MSSYSADATGFIRLPSQRTAMLPTSRPANYSNSEDFRLAGGRRQILTKNIKRTLPSVASGGRCLVRFTAEARISTSRVPRSTYRDESPTDKSPPWRRRGIRIRVRNSNQRLLVLPVRQSAYRFPYYRGIRDTCGVTLARCAAVRCGATRPQPRPMHIAHDRGERDTGVSSWEHSRMRFDRSAMDVPSSTAPSSCPFCIRSARLNSPPLNFILMRFARVPSHAISLALYLLRPPARPSA